MENKPTDYCKLAEEKGFVILKGNFDSDNTNLNEFQFTTKNYQEEFATFLEIANKLQIKVLYLEEFLYNFGEEEEFENEYNEEFKDDDSEIDEDDSVIEEENEIQNDNEIEPVTVSTISFIFNQIKHVFSLYSDEEFSELQSKVDERKNKENEIYQELEIKKESQIKKELEIIYDKLKNDQKYDKLKNIQQRLLYIEKLFPEFYTVKNQMYKIKEIMEKIKMEKTLIS